MKQLSFFIIIFIVLISCKEVKKDTTDHKNNTTENTSTNKKIGTIERLDPSIDKIIKPDAEIEIIAEGYTWSEGPLWLENEQQLLWSDVPNNIIYSWKEGEKAKIYLEPSGHTGPDPKNSREPGSNGLLLDKKGNLILCQHGDRRVSKMDAPLKNPEARFITIADRFKGKKFNSPNDAVFDEEGNLYFTDPPYGLIGIDDSEDKEIDFNGVYKVSPQGAVSVMVDSLSKPNGIAFSPDYKKCYVANSDPDKAYWAVYDITPEKTFTNGKIFFNATDKVANNKGLPDGLKVDNMGNLFATGPGGVLIFTPEAKQIGTINTGQATANCTFNNDKSILYMTAHSYIMRLKIN